MKEQEEQEIKLSEKIDEVKQLCDTALKTQITIDQFRDELNKLFLPKTNKNIDLTKRKWLEVWGDY